MQELFDELPHLSERERQAIAAKMRALTMRLLHRPLTQLKRLAQTDGIMEVVSQLFGEAETEDANLSP